MARIASTTSAGVPVDPTGGMTLDALMARQKALSDQRSQISAPRDIQSPWQGLAQMAQAFVGARQESAVADQAAAGRQALAQIRAGINPDTGPTADQISQASLYDPDLADRLTGMAADFVKEKRAREAAIADREDTQAFTGGENQKGRDVTVSEGELGREATAEGEARRSTAAAALQDDQQAATAEAAAKAAAQPKDEGAQVMAAFNAGQYGDPASPEAQAIRDARMAKINAIPGPQTIIQNGNATKLRDKFNEEVGTKMFPTYLREAGVAGGLQRGMELLDMLSENPQGPIAGRLAQMFPGVDTNAAAFESIVKRLAPAQREPGSGSTSDIEYAGMLASLPSLINNPEANKLISAMVKAQAQISIERGSIITKWQSGAMDDTAAFAALNDLNSRSIMTPQLDAMIKAAQTDQPIDTGDPATDPELDAILKKYPG